MRDGRAPLVLAAAAVVVVCAALPLVVLAGDAASSGALDLLASATTWRLFAGSLGLALAVTCVALALGVPLGILLGRCDVLARRVVLVVHAFPLFVPPFLLALGWFHAGAPHLFGRTGVVAVLGLAFAPIITTLTVLGLDGVDPALEDAARTTSRPRRVLLAISLPIARQSIAIGALLVFALAFSELGVPMFLRVPVYPTAVFARLGGLDYAPGEAFVLVLPQLAVALVLLAAERRWLGGTLGTLAVRRDRPTFALGRWRLPATIACAAVACLGALPLVALAARATWAGVWTWAGEALATSLFDAALAALVMTACGVVLGHALARGSRIARGVDAIAVFAFVTPAAALGAGLIALWSRPATQLVYASSAIVVLGYVARYASLAIRPIAAAVAQASVHLEEAAALADAGYARRLFAIVVPLHARAIVATWLFAMVFCLRDLETAVLYYPPGRQTLPVQIFTLEANGPPGIVAALATLHVAITAGLVALGLATLRRRRR